jgi:hypothetical protein
VTWGDPWEDWGVLDMPELEERSPKYKFPTCTAPLPCRELSDSSEEALQEFEEPFHDTFNPTPIGATSGLPQTLFSPAHSWSPVLSFCCLSIDSCKARICKKREGSNGGMRI